MAGVPFLAAVASYCVKAVALMVAPDRDPEAFRSPFDVLSIEHDQLGAPEGAGVVMSGTHRFAVCWVGSHRLWSNGMRQLAMVAAVAAAAAIWSTAFAQNSGNEPTPQAEVPHTAGQAPRAPVGHRQPQVKDLPADLQGKLGPSPEDRQTREPRAEPER